MERASKVTIHGKEYELILTTKATREIAKKHGGLSKLGERIMKEEDYDKAISEVIWLIALLANQGIEIKNLTTGSKDALLTENEIELLTTPLEIATFKDAIAEALIKGTKREVESEEEKPKNT